MINSDVLKLLSISIVSSSTRILESRLQMFVQDCKLLLI